MTAYGFWLPNDPRGSWSEFVRAVVARHTCSIEQVARLLKGAATSQLIKLELHPFAREPYQNGILPTPWTRHSWFVFLSNDDQIERAIDYVQRNPFARDSRSSVGTASPATRSHSAHR